MTKAKKPTGRPTLFTEELIDKILEQIADGANERDIFKQEGYPIWRAWTAFKRKESINENSTFMPQYRMAFEDKYLCWESLITNISDDQSRDQVPDGKGGYKSDNTAVNRDRLRVDSRKWLMAKALPKVYGDKLQQELSNPDGTAFAPILNINVKQ